MVVLCTPRLVSSQGSAPVAVPPTVYDGRSTVQWLEVARSNTLRNSHTKEHKTHTKTHAPKESRNGAPIVQPHASRGGERRYSPHDSPLTLAYTLSTPLVEFTLLCVHGGPSRWQCDKEYEATLAEEDSVQKQVATKLEALLENGLVLKDDRGELDFKALLFRKMLDGRLGSDWNASDEKRFQHLFQSN